MINLQDASGLPLLFDIQNNSIQPAGDIIYEGKEVVKLKNIKPILLNKTLRYPVQVYTEYEDIYLNKHKQIFEDHSLHYNLVIVPSGLLGVEYTKTHIFSPDQDQNEITAIVDVIYGEGVVLIQQAKEDEGFNINTEISFVKAYHAKKGDRVVVPQGYMYTFINSGSKPYVLGRLFENDGKIDYRTIRHERGMSYYVIRKNARKEIVTNPRYKTVPKLDEVKPEKNAKKHSLTSKKPIYTQAIRRPKRFEELLV